MGGLTILRDHVRELKIKGSPRLKEAFLRLEFAPGECAQVDWGEWICFWDWGKGPLFCNGSVLFTNDIY